MVTQNDKNFSSITHLSSFAGWFFPFGNILAPLILWLSKKNESIYIDSHGKSVLNFQLSILLFECLLALLIVPIAIFTLGLGVILIVLGVIPFIILKIFLIIDASLKATQGKYYTYPFTIEFIK